MVNTNQIAEIGTLVGEPARAAILGALMDGRALTATELSRVAGVTPQTASSHLARLTAANLLKVEKQGRHRYHRLAAPEVARMLEGIMQLASDSAPRHRKVVVGPRDAALRQARTCYDHFAGQLGVAITDALIEQQVIEFEDEAGMVTARGGDFLAGLGIDLPDSGTKPKRSARPICRPCLDWSERRPHVAGKLGAAICNYYLSEGLVRRINGSRALNITPKGKAALRDMFGVRGLS